MAPLRCSYAFLLVVALLQLGSTDQVSSSEDNELDLDDWSFMDDNVLRLNIDKLFDKNLPRMKKMILEKGLDPTNAKDLDIDLTRKIGMKLREGLMENISHLKRSGSTSLKYAKKIISLDLNLGWDSLHFNYNYNLFVLIFKRTGKFHVRLIEPKIHIDLELDLAERELRLMNMKITDTDKTIFELEGNFGDKFLNWILEIATRLCKTEFNKMLQNVSIDIIKFKLEDIKDILPLYGDNKSDYKFVNLATLEQ